jgi:hypothetical protein
MEISVGKERKKLSPKEFGLLSFLWTIWDRSSAEKNCSKVFGFPGRSRIAALWTSISGVIAKKLKSINRTPVGYSRDGGKDILWSPKGVPWSDRKNLKPILSSRVFEPLAFSLKLSIEFRNSLECAASYDGKPGGVFGRFPVCQTHLGSSLAHAPSLPARVARIFRTLARTCPGGGTMVVAASSRIGTGESHTSRTVSAPAVRHPASDH